MGSHRRTLSKRSVAGGTPTLRTEQQLEERAPIVSIPTPQKEHRLMKVFKSKKAKGTLGVVVALAVAVAAIAYWTAGGSGSGSGSVAAQNGSITLGGSGGNQPVSGGTPPLSLEASDTKSSSPKGGKGGGTGPGRGGAGC